MSGKPDLDGQRGVVTAFIASSGLCSVELEDGRGSVNIKPENLVAKGRGGGDANADFPAESAGPIPLPEPTAGPTGDEQTMGGGSDGKEVQQTMGNFDPETGQPIQKFDPETGARL